MRETDHFDLSANKYRDGLAIIYHRQPVYMPHQMFMVRMILIWIMLYAVKLGVSYLEDITKSKTAR